MRDYDYRLASNLAGQEPEDERLAVSARIYAVNAGNKKCAVSEYCAPMKKPINNPNVETVVVAFLFKGHR